ncbi:MAG: hypothetical protein ACTSRS_13795 [Candidatus Helarchaeota archaeon]
MEKILNNLLQHEEFRKNSLNMIASENRTSPLVRILMASDVAHRYTDELYGGTRFIRRIVNICEELVKDLFQSDYALITPLSGNFAVLSTLFSLTKPGNLVAKVFNEDGGYPLNLQAFNRLGLKLFFDHDSRTIDIDRCANSLLASPPALILLGQSIFTHPHPVQTFRSFLDEHQLKTPLAYDGSHVLGLIAGHQFQNPLQEGAEVLLGSTHKSFFGPQGGLIVSNNRRLFRKIANIGGFTQGSHALVDNIHNHRILALTVATLEFLEFGKAYATQVVKNSKALARQLHRNGLPVKGAKVDFTESHQVLLDYSQKIAFQIKNKLESIGIITDALLRFGTSEVTRLGMTESQMTEIANIITDCIQENLQLEKLIKRTKDLVKDYQKVQYTFDISEIPAIRQLIRDYLSF